MDAGQIDLDKRNAHNKSYKSWRHIERLNFCVFVFIVVSILPRELIDERENQRC